MWPFIIRLYEDVRDKLSTAQLILLLSALLLVPVAFSVPNVIEYVPPHLRQYLVWAQMGYVILAFLMLVIMAILVYKNPELQIIAWKGYGEQSIQKHFRHRTFILEYVRGVEKVSHLRYRTPTGKASSTFDILIADLEFLRRHDGYRLLPLRSEIDRLQLHDKLPADVLSFATSYGNETGIPIRCGLNALIVNKTEAQRILPLIIHNARMAGKSLIDLGVSKTNGGYKIDSYKLFAPSNFPLFPDAGDIGSPGVVGLWNWYLPSLAVLLLADGISRHDIFGTDGKRARQLTQQLTTYCSKFILYDDPEEAMHALCSGRVWAIPGGAGWLTPTEPSEASHLEVIVPREGAFLWIECLAFIVNDEPTRLRKKYLEYLLRKATQQRLAQTTAYKACPVTADALKDINAEIARKNDRYSIFDNNLRLMNNLTIRRLPQGLAGEHYWLYWEDAWEDFNRSWQSRR